MRLLLAILFSVACWANAMAQTGIGQLLPGQIVGSPPQSTGPRPPRAMFGSKVFNVLDFGTPGTVMGTGTNDDGPAIRAALAACQASGAGGFASIYFPQPPVGYLVKTLDASGLGGIVIGDGTNPNSCTFQGQAVNTTQGFAGGTFIKLDNGLNRPLIYVRSGAGSPVFKDIGLNGNGAGQAGCTTAGAGTACPSNRLYTVVAADGVASPEGSAQFINSFVINGYNGNLYQGSGRGGVFCYNSWFQFGGQATNDANLSLNAYDDNFDGCAIGPHKGIGILITQGSQYFFTNTAIFCNQIGTQINSGLVGYVSHVNTNYQYNSTNGILSIGGGQTGNQSLVSVHQWVNTTFDANNTNNTNNNGACSATPGGGTASDVLVQNDPFVVLVSPNFVGNEVNNTAAKGVNNIQFNDGGGTPSVAQVVAPSYNTSSYTSAFTNDFTKVVLTSPGIIASPTGIDLFLNSRGSNINYQFNGTTAVAQSSTAINPLTGNAINLGAAPSNGWSNVVSNKFTAIGAATAVSAGQISYGGTTVAAGTGTCPATINTSISATQAVQACIVVNIAGTARNIPLF